MDCGARGSGSVDQIGTSATAVATTNIESTYPVGYEA